MQIIEGLRPATAQGVVVYNGERGHRTPLHASPVFQCLQCGHWAPSRLHLTGVRVGICVPAFTWPECSSHGGIR